MNRGKGPNEAGLLDGERTLTRSQNRFGCSAVVHPTGRGAGPRVHRPSAPARSAAVLDGAAVGGGQFDPTQKLRNKVDLQVTTGVGVRRFLGVEEPPAASTPGEYGLGLMEDRQFAGSLRRQQQSHQGEVHVDRGERIDVSGVVGQFVLGSEEVSASVSFLLYGAAELGALESNGRLTSTHEILSAVASRLVAAAAADHAHQHPGYAAGPIWTAHSLLRAARILADLHEGCERATVARLDLLLESMRGGNRGAKHEGVR